MINSIWSRFRSVKLTPKILIILTAWIIVGVIAQAVLPSEPVTSPSSAMPSESLPKLTDDGRGAINTTLQTAGFPTPISIEYDESSRFLRITFELAAGRFRDDKEIEQFAGRALLMVRNSMYGTPSQITDHYSVIVNGPSPGPGLIRRYGTMRFIEAGSMEWQPTTN